MGVLALTLYGGCLIEVRQKLVLGHSPQTRIGRVVRMRYPRDM